MRSSEVALISVALLCGCPGEPVEGSGSADGGSTSGDGSMTVTSNTMTMGSQSATDGTDGSVSVSATSTEETANDPTGDPTGDPTSATLDETSTVETTASDTVAEASAGTTDAETTSLSAGTTDGTTDTGACVEPDEPNQDEASAWDQGAIACNAAAVDVPAIAHDATTPDWFRFFGDFVDDMTCANMDGAPRAELVDAPGLEVCIFCGCPANVTEVTCLDGATPANSPVGGLPGCCATDVVAAALNCSMNGDESSDVFVSVATAGAACQEYTLRLSY